MAIEIIIKPAICTVSTWLSWSRRIAQHNCPEVTGMGAAY